MPQVQTIRLDPDQLDAIVEQIAERVLAELGRRDAPAPVERPLTAREVGELLGRSVDWVRQHRHKLGVLPAEGKRPRLLFDPQRVREYTQAETPEPRTPPAPVRRRKRPARRDPSELLPIRGKPPW